MKLASLCMATVLAFGGSALAQTSTPAPADQAAPTAPSEPPTAAPDPAAPTAPNTPPAQTTPKGNLTPGANSFTEAQARSWLEEAGYTDVTGLVQTPDGIWRGHAKHNGAMVSVGVDYKGTISTQ